MGLCDVYSIPVMPYPTAFGKTSFLTGGRSVFAILLEQNRGQKFHVDLKRDPDDVIGRDSNMPCVAKPSRMCGFPFPRFGNSEY